MQILSNESGVGGVIYYTGSLQHKNVLLILGRTNFLKDEALISRIAERFVKDDLTVLCYEHEGVSVTRSIDLTCTRILGAHPWMERLFGKKRARLLLKGFFHARHPASWHYFFLRRFYPDKLIPLQESRLRAFLKSLGADRNVFFFTRSAGGRIASLVEDEPNVRKIVCLGYPFKHPEKPQETERVAHLATMKKPLLIIQGEQDEYGGRGVLEAYALSPQITVQFVNANHDFRLSDAAWEEVVEQIKAFFGIYG